MAARNILSWYSSFQSWEAAGRGKPEEAVESGVPWKWNDVRSFDFVYKMKIVYLICSFT